MSSGTGLDYCDTWRFYFVFLREPCLIPNAQQSRPAPERTRSIDVCGITRPHRTATNIEESSLCIVLPSLSISVNPSQKLPDVKKIRQSRSATALESSD